MANDFTYKLEADINPSSGSVGTPVTLSARLNDVQGSEVNSVQAAVPAYGWFASLRSAGNNRWNLTQPVPYGAPHTTVQIKIYAISKDGKSGPSIEVPFTIT